MTTPAPTLVTSTCLGCGQNDSHPKHVMIINGSHESVAWHMDCHSRAGTPCDVCTTQISGAGGAKGDALRTHLVGLAATDELLPLSADVPLTTTTTAGA